MPTDAAEFACVILLAELAAAATLNSVGVVEARLGVKVALASVLGMGLAAFTTTAAGVRVEGLEQLRVIVGVAVVRKLVLTMLTVTEASATFVPAVVGAAKNVYVPDAAAAQPAAGVNV
jgi:hypothetical protein